MSELKCPFCKKELKLIGEKSDSGYPIDEYFCGCPQTAFHFGNTPMWNELRVLHEKLEERKESCKVAEKELIRTRKALDVAVDALKNVFDYAKIVHSELQKNHLSQFQTPISKMQYSAQQALKQITALEQKDVK